MIYLARAMCVDVHEGPKTAVEKAEAAKANLLSIKEGGNFRMFSL